MPVRTPDNWTQEQETLFQGWYNHWSTVLGLDPNPDDPRHHYKWRDAWLYGAMPDPNSGHWPSQFKTEKHPRRYIKGVDTITGKKK